MVVVWREVVFADTVASSIALMVRGFGQMPQQSLLLPPAGYIHVRQSCDTVRSPHGASSNGAFTPAQTTELIPFASA